MGEYTTSDGREVSIERDDAGNYMVRDNEGRWTRYGEDVAANIYKDWNLSGQDLSDSEVPDEPDDD